MAYLVLIIGESGAGKSTSIEKLNPEETFIVSTLEKPLPFKGAKSLYKKSQGKEQGNLFVTESAEVAANAIKYVSDKLPHIKNIVIDDFQYFLSIPYMRRASEKGFDKFTEIGRNGWALLDVAGKLRNDLKIFVMSHSEQKEDGSVKAKTIGKMLDEKISLEGLFTMVLHAMKTDGEYKFLTQQEKPHLAKSPRGMFDSLYIDNDLGLVARAMDAYESGEEGGTEK